MAVVYMRKLELEPETYDSKFTALTKGVNLQVKDWVLTRVGTTDSILEVGCGTGALAAQMALKGNEVLAIDTNLNMINTAMNNHPEEKEVKLLYQIGSMAYLPANDESQDKIVSTFMLSELRPLEQQIFLRNAWSALKPGGKLIISAEFIPTGFWKLPFKIKRWRYKKKLRRLRLENTLLVKDFFDYLEPIGFKIIAEKKWKHNSIQAIEVVKINDSERTSPGYYFPKPRKFTGFGSQMSIYRILFTGQTTHIPIEPGIYKSGQPDENSPIIVTANYLFTYIKVMRDIKGIDAWVLCVDSKGINVWCAARGNNFGNRQVIEAVEATGIATLTNKKTLILPQLSAGGVAGPLISKEAPDFPFRILFGPVWAKQLPQFLKERPARKPDKMKLAKFTPFHRLRAGITHTTFLLKMIFMKPTIILILLSLGLAFIDPLWVRRLWAIGELWLWIIIANGLIAGFFPITNFTRRFIIKGITFGILTVIALSSVSWLFHQNIFLILLNSVFYFWLAFFSTMSFSGYSMATSPKEIQDEYPAFRKIHLILLISSLVLYAIGFIFF
ncbi:hypothetical protein LCGC14_2098220 [marine sediment metagenome]|uniref:Methyltransferase domain-containing protein n=1 Tax=marine sediment metagenome TaxID=412755 RepID=A0A0F9H758_9ZZZZ